MKALSLMAIGLAMVSTSAMATESDMSLCGKLADAWKTAYDNKEADKVAAMYDPSAGLYSNPFWTATGRDELEKGFKVDFSMDASFSNITCDAAESDGKLLVAHGTYVASAKGADGKTMPMTGHWFATAMAKGDGGYLMMTHNANMQLPPPK